MSNSKRRFLVPTIHSPPLLPVLCAKRCRRTPRRRPKQRVNSRCGNDEANQIMDRSLHMTTKYVKGSQVDKFINNRFLKTLNELPEEIYEVEL